MANPNGRARCITGAGPDIDKPIALTGRIGSVSFGMTMRQRLSSQVLALAPLN